MKTLVEAAQMQPAILKYAADLGEDLIQSVRANPRYESPFYHFMVKYNLKTEEGIALMSLVEALLRVPDGATSLRLIRDKLGPIDWKTTKGNGDIKEPFLNHFATFGLRTLKRMALFLNPNSSNPLSRIMGAGLTKSFLLGVHAFSHQFVAGKDMKKALQKMKSERLKKYFFSFDMLGEGARTDAMAARYYQSYTDAIESLSSFEMAKDPYDNHGISVKLSALHPRYEPLHRTETFKVLFPKLLLLCKRCKELNINLTIDAEEVERLDISLDYIEAIARHPVLTGWTGFGFVIQAYQKRALSLVKWTVKLAKESEKRIGVRLVKGAYWDYEVKLAQQKNMEDYPVFTKKSLTDISYLACARELLNNRHLIYPQFATHNADTIATILGMCGEQKGFEFQKLYGMGNGIYENLFERVDYTTPCRVYAPVGAPHDLLPYLVRRLLENGANSSFVYKLYAPCADISQLTTSPFAKVAANPAFDHPQIPNPKDIYMPDRLNSEGMDLSHAPSLINLEKAILPVKEEMPWRVASIIDGKEYENGPGKDLTAPWDYMEEIGVAWDATDDQILDAYWSAHHFFDTWKRTSIETRAAYLEKFADLLEEHKEKFIALCSIEAGKTLQDGIDEVREAVDFCRYYAVEAKKMFGAPLKMPGYTGENNFLSYEGRGVFLCISPWNFPLAIFVGQIAAALVTGNTVLAKPAATTSIISYHAIKLFHQAGVPQAALHLLLAGGRQVSDVLIGAQSLGGIVFTGSTTTAKAIQKKMTAQDILAPLIAETGGINAMIVDSTALPEQVCDDVIRSAFQSAGQRCSALRLLYLQEDIADTVIELIKGRMDKIKVGDPLLPETDMGPLISYEAKADLQEYMKDLKNGTLLHTLRRPEGMADGAFLMPHLYEVQKASDIPREAFGPILHVRRFKARELDVIIDEINHTNYGLTCGLQTRIKERVQYLAARLNVGNLYVNRDMIGAIVGTQPFGGQKLSGTGPKAGGPNYLHRFTTEKTLTDNITAGGGNTDLLNLEE